jgi:hypothetical protein
MPTNIQLSYFAGSIDSDGFITIQRKCRSQGAKYAHRPIYYAARIGFTSTENIVPKLFHEAFGGSLYPYTPKNKAHKVVWNWTVTSNVAGDVAQQLLPYLHLKKEQAKILIEFVTLIESQRHRCMKNRISPEIEATRCKLWTALVKLNKPRNQRVHF